MHELLDAIVAGLQSREALLIFLAALGTLFGLAELYCHAGPRRKEMLAWANLATLTRVGFTFGIVYWVKHPDIVFVCALAGGISDIVDGWLANWRGKTEFGARFDQYTDWCFGAALGYAVWVFDGFTWYNLPLATTIGLYLIWRACYPSVETNRAAKTKTFLQFGGGTAVLAGHAFWWPLIAIGYAMLWLSLWPMVTSWRDYIAATRSANH